MKKIESRDFDIFINSTRLDKIIDKILSNSSEFYRKVCDNLTVQERLFILELLKNKSCLNCANGSCRISEQEKHKFTNTQGSDCYGWFNSEIIGKAKVMKISDINKLI